MGLNVGDLVQLIDLRRAGVSFDSVITLGRQFTIGAPEEFARLLIEKGYPAADVQELVKQDLTYVDPILRFLGAQTVDSMDYSDYESATVIHDLNQPLPGHLKRRYSLVIDGGTIEHVFNAPEALRTALELPAKDGYLFMLQPANNQCGHGFYQFSPELMFRLLVPENGYRLERVALCETFPRNGYRAGAIAEVRDPAELGYRNILDSGVSVNILSIAQRVEVKNVLESPPLQSDYAAVWNEFADKKTTDLKWAGPNVRGLKQRLIATLDARYPRLMAVTRTLSDPLKNPRFYKN
jgi:hypothetical protein